MDIMWLSARNRLREEGVPEQQISCLEIKGNRALVAKQSPLSGGLGGLLAAIMGDLPDGVSVGVMSGDGMSGGMSLADLFDEDDEPTPGCNCPGCQKLRRQREESGAEADNR